MKNKLAPPFREAEFEILYGTGVNARASSSTWRRRLGLVEKSGTWYSYEGERIGQGREKACAFVAEHPEITQEVRLTLVAARKAENAALGAPAPVAQAA